VIDLEHVSKRYGEAVVLDDVTLHVRAGELVFVTGASGAGKSTLLRLLFAAERPSSGVVRVAGRDVSRIRTSGIPYLRRNVGVVFQDFKLLRQRTAAENVALALEVLGARRQEIARRVGAALAEVGLAHRADALPERLSGGEQQRLAVARAIVGEPAVLLADEPTGNLDAAAAAEVLRLLLAAHARGTTVLVATHDLALLERAQPRVVTLERGKVVADRPPGNGAPHASGNDAR
jgi:cell division transport system ATP-binding protein